MSIYGHNIDTFRSSQRDLPASLSILCLRIRFSLTHPYTTPVILVSKRGSYVMEDNHYRMRLKIGVNEFEAEGPVDVVQAQVKRFMDLVASLPIEPPTQRPTERTNGDSSAAT